MSQPYIFLLLREGERKMEDIRSVIGNRVKRLRRKIKISQEELAGRADLDRTYVTSIENGRRNVSMVNIERLALALNCSICEFFSAKEFKTKTMYGRIDDKEKLAKVAEDKKRKYK